VFCLYQLFEVIIVVLKQRHNYVERIETWLGKLATGAKANALVIYLLGGL